MFDAQDAILKIIGLIETRLEKLKDIKHACRKVQPDPAIVKKLYSEAVRISGRIYEEIRVLKQIEKTLVRPFVFQGMIYDEDHMHAQMKRRRLQILQQFPELANANELKRFLLANGTISDVRQISREETELKEEEPLYSSSSEDEDS